MSTNGAGVDVQITDFDTNKIKADQTLATSSSTTFIAMGAGALKTVFDVAVLAIIPDVAGTVTSYTADNVPPVLNNFAIALNSGSIPFPFSETVDVLTLDPREFRLGNAASTSSTVALTGGVASPNKTAISFTLALVESDLSAIKSNTALDYFENNSFALISSCFIRDPNNVVAVTAIADGAAREALVVTPDITAPTLVPFSLNMNASTSRIGFSESVKAAALNPNKLIIQQGASAGCVSKQLAGGSAVQVDDTTEELTLKNDDLNNLKAGQARYCHLHE